MHIRSNVNQLCLNLAKTQLVWLGPKWQVEKVDVLNVPIMATSVRKADSMRDQGVVVDSHLTITMHVCAVCHAAYYKLWQLCLLIRSLSFDAAKLLTTGIHFNMQDQRQAVLMLTSHSKCRSLPITNTRRCEHVTPVLQQLHWLPVGQHVQFKIATLVYKALHDLLPAYLMEDCQHVSVTGRRQLRWSDVDTCLVQQINICLDNRSLIHAAGRQLRNSL